MCQLSVAYWQLWQNRHACTNGHLLAAQLYPSVLWSLADGGTAMQEGLADGFGIPS